MAATELTSNANATIERGTHQPWCLRFWVNSQLVSFVHGPIDHLGMHSPLFSWNIVLALRFRGGSEFRRQISTGLLQPGLRRGCAPCSWER